MSRLPLTMSLIRRAADKVMDRAVVPEPEITWDLMREVASVASIEAGEWGGAPVPVEGSPLVMEPRYPFKGLEQIGQTPKPTTPQDWTLLNQWYCFGRNSIVYVCREANGKSRAYLSPDGAGRRLQFWIKTLGVACVAWDERTERRAMEKLKSLITAHAYKCYVLTGGFLETSNRSKVTYVFRRLRPTIALRPDRNMTMRAIAVLCLHPLGYYSDTWAGVQCPTDDVISHLLMMRGSEHQFWKKANHHSLAMASAGV